MSTVPYDIKAQIEREKREEIITEHIKNITLKIEQLIESEESTVVKFYNEFHSFASAFLSLSSGSGLNEPLQNVMSYCFKLKNLAEYNLYVFSQILEFTSSEEDSEERKFSVKVTIIDEFKEELRLSRTLQLKRDVKKLLKEIVGNVKSERKVTEKDIDIDKKTLSLIKKVTETTGSIKDLLEKITDTPPGELLTLKKEIKNLDDAIKGEIKTFLGLSQLERAHLELLIKLHSSEDKTVAFEGALQQKEQEL